MHVHDHTTWSKVYFLIAELCLKLGCKDYSVPIPDIFVPEGKLNSGNCFGHHVLILLSKLILSSIDFVCVALALVCCGIRKIISISWCIRSRRQLYFTNVFDLWNNVRGCERIWRPAIVRFFSFGTTRSFQVKARTQTRNFWSNTWYDRIKY